MPQMESHQGGLAAALSQLPGRLHEDMLDWCRGKLWWIRLPLTLYLAYVMVRQFKDPIYYSSWFGGINLGIHEAGHLVFQFAGEFICAAGGTILQLLAPIASIVMFLKQRDYYAITVCFGWLGTNFCGIGVYMSDAMKMALPLVTVGDPPGGIAKHDWRYLFGKLGLLQQCETIGWLTMRLGDVFMLLSLVGGAYVMWCMFRSEKTARQSTPTRPRPAPPVVLPQDPAEPPDIHSPAPPPQQQPPQQPEGPRPAPPTQGPAAPPPVPPRPPKPKPPPKKDDPFAFN